VNEKHFILATAGHVDHGKSALVKALTGVDPDRLPEEKRRGITIDLGFAHFQLASPNEPNENYSIGIVDVPGHEDFVKNMVAGVGAIDLALLTVAADDGWMPQTEEHLQILVYLGVRRIVVAITKIDLAKSIEGVEADVRAKLRDSPFSDAPIVKTSTVNNTGLDDLRVRLAREFSLLKPPPDHGKPRLFVDRAFTLRGAGTIVTGTLSGGTFQRGETVTLQPAALPVRIRSLQNHNREIEKIGPGMRGALNIPDLAIARRSSDQGVRRGDVVTRPDLGNASAILDVMLTRSPRLLSSAPPVTHGVRVRVHHGSGNLRARLFFPDGKALTAGETTLAEFRLESPVLAFVGDRFVIRDSSEQHTLGGGIILDAEANTKKFRNSAQRRFLEDRAASALDVRVFVETQVRRDHFISRSNLLIKSCFSTEEISEALRSLSDGKGLVLLRDFVVDAEWWNSMRSEALSAIDGEHETSPHHLGLDLVRLRNLFPNETSAVFEAFVADLCEHGVIRVGDVIKRVGHQPALPPELQGPGAAIRRELAAKPFDPPSRRELAPNAPSQQALRFLINNGEVIDVGDEVLLSKDAFQKMRDNVMDFIHRHGPATVGELRQSLGSSRRVMIPFLEKLDREGVTRRVGDKRTLATL